jgi:hypothetical protein
MCGVRNVVLIIPMLAPLSSVADLAIDLTHWAFGGRVVAGVGDLDDLVAIFLFD